MKQKNKAPTKDGEAEWYVGWCKETKSAWRCLPQSPNAKQFTKDLRAPPNATGLSPCVAWWGDYSHEVSAINVEYLKELTASKVSSVPTFTKSTRVGEQNIEFTLKVKGRTGGKQRFVTLQLIQKGFKQEQQLVQILDDGSEERSAMASKLAEDYVDGSIAGVDYNLYALQSDRAIMQRERDRRLEGVGKRKTDSAPPPEKKLKTESKLKEALLDKQLTALGSKAKSKPQPPKEKKSAGSTATGSKEPSESEDKAIPPSTPPDSRSKSSSSQSESNADSSDDDLPAESFSAFLSAAGH